jgi:hypothetical protein
MSELAIGIFILIIPGIVMLIIISDLIIHKKWEPFFYSLYAIVLGILSYGTLQIAYWFLDLLCTLIFRIPVSFSLLSIWNLNLVKEMRFNAFEIFLTSAMAFPLAIFICFIINRKFFHSSAAKSGFTQKYGDESLFYYFLNSKRVNWVYVRDIDRDLVFEGRVNSYSEDDQKQELVLVDVSVYTYYSPTKIYETESVYLAREHGKFHIELIPKEAFLTEEIKGGKRNHN